MKKYNPTAKEVISKLIRIVRIRKLQAVKDEARQSPSGHYRCAIQSRQIQSTCDGFIMVLKLESGKIGKSLKTP